MGPSRNSKKVSSDRKSAEETTPFENKGLSDNVISNGIKVEIPALPTYFNNIKVNKILLHEVITSILANKRHSTAHTKTRGEVSGGGKKPWRQKGTGRARAGSIRSPLWRGGGIVFGPRNERSYKKRLTKKKKRKAVLQIIMQHLQEKNLRVVDEIRLTEPKTRLASNFINEVFKKDGSKILVLLDERKPEIIRAFRNIKNVTITDWRNIDAYDLMKNKKLLYSRNAWENFLSSKGVK